MSQLDELFPAERAWEFENGYYLTSHPTRLGKLLAHYELYRRIVDLPGHVLELGVYKGASLVRFATIRSLLESESSRRIVGFDAFGRFPSDGLSPDDAGFVSRFEAEGGDGFSRVTILDALERKRLFNVELIEGDVLTTLPTFIASHPELRVALLHLDLDVYEPTKTSLELLGERVVRGGLIVIDDYGTVAGATEAVDEYIESRELVVQKLPISHVPAFVVCD